MNEYCVQYSEDSFECDAARQNRLKTKNRKQLIRKETSEKTKAKFQ